MVGVNRVLLLGVVAERSRERDDGCELVVAIPEGRAGRTWLERITLLIRGPLVPAAVDLCLAQPLYADGHLTSGAEGAVVEVSHLFSLGDPPPLGRPPRTAAGSHASPCAHERTGHPRRIHAGWADERVIWVGPAHVGGGRSSDR